MKKILYMCFWDNDATFFLRLAILTYLKHPDFTIERKPYNGDITWSTFLGYDVLVLSRPSSPHDLSIIKLAKQCGLKVITDYDDDIIHLPELNPMWHHYQQCKSDAMECISLSDEVWVSTKGVKKSFALLNSNIHVIPNSLNDYLHPVDKKKPFNEGGKKAIWRGGGAHQADVYEVAESLVQTINNNKDWHFQFVGDRFVFLEQRCGDNYLPVSLMPLMQYMEYLHTENPQAVFHPLVTNRFNEGKSNLAWIEATYAGAAFFGNTKLHEFNKNGIIDFSQLETGMTTNFELLKDCNEESWEYILENLLLSNVNLIRQQRLLNI